MSIGTFQKRGILENPKRAFWNSGKSEHLKILKNPKRAFWNSEKSEKGFLEF